MTMTISGSGTITGLSAGGLPDSTIVQADLATGVAGTGPAFRANPSANQTGITSATSTKVLLQTETFDTASCFNNTGSTVSGIPAYAFLPNVAGYYQVNFGIAFSGAATSYGLAQLYKNGSLYSYGNYTSLATGDWASRGSELVYLNGSTDYLELYGNAVVSAGTVSFLGSSSALTYFSASMTRAA